MTTPPHSFIDGLRDQRETAWPALLRDVCSRPQETQQSVLLDIVRRNAQTEYGRTHDFGAINSIEDYRHRVAISHWDAIGPLAQRMEAGEEDILFAGPAVYFIATSGSTGAPKLLPESADGQFIKSMVSRMRMALLLRMAPSVLEGTFVPLANVGSFSRTSGNIPIGYASGLTLVDAPPEILRRMAFPPAIMKVTDRDTLDYLIMRFALASPEVRLLAGNNAGRITTLLETADHHRDTLLDDIEKGTLGSGLKLDASLRHELEQGLAPDPQRAGELRLLLAARGRLEPRDYWPRLSMVACWLGGTIGRYLAGLKPWLPAHVIYADLGYGASEGKFNLNMEPGVATGPLASFGYFFEFMPADGGAPLLAHEVRDGESYELIVTSYSGLYRYAMHDLVRVDGFTGRTPNIEFVGKSQDVANLSGEKVNGAMAAEAIRDVLAARGIRWNHFCLVADAASQRYVLCIESDGLPIPDSDCAKQFDQLMKERHPLYLMFRSQRLLQEPGLTRMKPGWHNRLYAAATQAGRNVAQVKLPVVYAEIPLGDWVMTDDDTVGAS